MLLTEFTEPAEGLYHVQKDTQAFLQDECLGKGTLYITEDHLSWCDITTVKGFSLDYPSISLHAICKDVAAFPHECLFCMVEGVLEETENEENEEDDPPSGEIRFVPDDKTSLEQIYLAIADCQVLHPDEQEQIEEEMAGYPLDHGEEFFTSEGEERPCLSENGQVTLDRLENIFQVQTPEEFVRMTNNVNGHDGNDGGQFEDVDDN